MKISRLGFYGRRTAIWLRTKTLLWWKETDLPWRGQRTGYRSWFRLNHQRQWGSTGAASTSAFPSKAPSSASPMDGRGVGGSEPGINHCERDLCCEVVCGYEKGERFWDGKVWFWKRLTDKNDLCKETNRLDSSTDCYDTYWVPRWVLGVFTEDMNERRISFVSEPHACNANGDLSAVSVTPTIIRQGCREEFVLDQRFVIDEAK